MNNLDDTIEYRQMLRWSPLYGVRDRLPEGCGFVEGLPLTGCESFVWAARDPASFAQVLKSQFRETSVHNIGQPPDQ
jgi:hypothetical protein